AGGRRVEQAGPRARLASRPAAFAYDLAGVHALSARAAAGEAGRPLPEREKRAEGYARAALLLLERAGEAGHFRAAKALDALKKDVELEFLRGREDFRQFLSRVEAKQP